MTKEDLFKLIEQTGMHPVPLKEEDDDELSSVNYFDGTLEEFLRTAKAVGATAIFVQTKLLEPHHFIYQIESYDEEYTDDEPETDEEIEAQEEQAIDLTTISPALAEFKKFIGKEYNFSMSAKGGAGELNLEWFAPWDDEFEEEFDKAVEKIDEDVDAKADEEERLNEAKQIESSTKIKKLIGRLMDDPKFVKIKTLREMKLYALTKFPELEELEQDADITIQDAVRDVRDQINIKGLRN